ncbi:MAG: hypothetical protein ABI867_00310 [Kofleriaceae bacterium]
MPTTAASELAIALTSPGFHAIVPISGIDLMLVRDADATDAPLDAHLAIAGLARTDWERWSYLRGALSASERVTIANAVAATAHPGYVELLACTCESAREFAAASRRAFPKGPPAKLAGAFDYAARRFIAEPAVAKRLARRAKSYATTAKRGTWDEDGMLAWRALYVSDVREAADALAAMLAAIFEYTNHGPKERVLHATTKRIRSLTHRTRARAAVMVALAASYSGEEVTHTAIALDGAKLRPALEARWRDYTQYQMDNDPARVALGGLLAIAPRVASYHAAARKILPVLMAEHEDITADDLGLINGLVMGIAHGRVKPLYPLLEKLARWKFTGSRFDNHGPLRAEVAGELMRRRARAAIGR